MSPKLKILSIFGGSVMANRGTPIRVKNILYELAKKEDLILYTHTLDDALNFSNHHTRFFGHFLQDLKHVLKIVQDENIDVVVGHTITTYKLLTVIKFLTRAKIVLETHGFLEEEARLTGNISPIKYFLSKAAYSWFYTLPHIITTCSETATEKIKKFNTNVVTVFGGVDVRMFHPFPSVSHNKIIVGYAGNARSWQGLSFLLDVFDSDRILKRNFELRLLLSEKITLPPNLPSVTVQHSVPTNEVPYVLSNYDVLVIPRPYNEVNRLSFPSKLMEYLAMGLPVVASKTSDMHKIIDDGINGLLYEPGNEEEFINCLLKLEDSEFRQRLGVAARQLVVENYTWEKQANLIISEIKNIFS